MSKLTDNIITSKLGWLWLIIALVMINLAASVLHTRIDLTKEKRYTLSGATSSLLGNLNGPVEIDVFLKGEFPSGFRKLANSTQEFLQLMKDRNGSNIQYRFVSPQEKIPGSDVMFGDSLVNMGAVPINLTVQKDAGQSSNIIFPVAVMRYNGRQALVNLYPGASGRISQEEINSAEALMEYQFAKTLDNLSQNRQPIIGYAVGNGEPTNYKAWDLSQTLSKGYDFRMFDLQNFPAIPDSMGLLMIVKPITQFTEQEKLKIDQYMMRGGKLLCFMDALIAEQDSLSFKPETIAYDRNLNLTDLFFRYGLRVNPDLIMDLQCDMIPLVVGGTADNPQMEFLRWNYYPLFSPGTGQIMSKIPGYIGSRFANSIDTIQVPGIKKTVLLASSAHSRTISTPALISFNENRNTPEDAKFNKNGIPVAMMLEGKFTSLYRNRASQAQRDSLAAVGVDFRGEGTEPGKIIVVGDGDIVLNDMLPGENGNPPQPLPMGWNRYTYRESERQTDAGRYFVPVANREFLQTCVEYLVNNPAISETRNKDIVLRLLDSQKVKENRVMWQFLNIGLPVILVIIAGFIFQYIRKRKYIA
ncbi:gliding motility-associated ABC transporter substrate-binding protein GldG [Terrimonas sp. NA20]|uniref:Gliding motility-associated ABC transporter substrate-binding protein GldG n=1 Tax=Terrimonas ginsenosidimutans TaxID=2908004 RepID=A0ABS9KQN1_9BACT|nr:gliding motility-associated ABC transporter substrate-binding protein GldG [Terrimonas ginsenosidimutans]MCG2614633.1 gliding motility-associated ABC transporter substrate-binding protein GldG [Terrimonas ginsenosidimutans]